MCFFICVFFYHVPTRRKRKPKFVDKLKSKYLCFQNGCDKWEAESLLSKPGTCMSLVNKGALDL